jgi:hypothetical protein
VSQFDFIADAHIVEDMIASDPRERRKAVGDHPRHPRPAGDPPEPQAQWNELSGQWERWDEASQDWVLVGEPGPGIELRWDDEPGADDSPS